LHSECLLNPADFLLGNKMLGKDDSEIYDVSILLLTQVETPL